tara:strand:+ start:974 stop:2008 length:1035 start_codon:yes stop_codon:yes gene_type:complete
MSEFRVNSITNQDGSAGPQICGISTFSGKSGVQIPSGPTEFRRQDGGGRGRGVFSGGRNNPVFYSNLSVVEIATTGNATDFGDMSKKVNGGSGNVSSSTRGITSGGYDGDASANVRHIDFFNFASSGGSNTFGELTEDSNDHGAYSNGRRGIFSMGYPSYSGEITFITIASTGNANNFGNLSGAKYSTCGGVNSPTRAVLPAIETPSSSQNLMTEFITFDTLGNSQDFGELSVARNACAGGSSSTRGIVQGGLTPSVSDVIDFCTIATLGNFADFGNLTVGRRSPGGCSSEVRGLCAAGTTPTNQNVIDFVTIASTGNSTDFGDLSYSARNVRGNSDAHGGLAQ